MKLKRLEIKGFKSFSDRTILEFRPGVTSVVGPNGCGKSNVLEAIRWVMGEQRARILRGHKMGDVIFNGSENRKPLGMAEVRMILSNDNDSSPASLSDYDEIMITRRLFRDGESHYEINSIPCRLSDVTDLFLDTGIGRSSYSVVEQGRVEMVVASRPEERRTLIEEAAGINRYKARKEAALKKLEQTNRNLERIKDVIAEVKRQNLSLRRQAAKAEGYHKLQNRYRDLDIAIHAWKCRDALEQYGQAKGDLDRASSAFFEQESLFASLEARLETASLKAVDLEKAIKELLQTRHVTDISLTSIRGAIRKDQDRLVHITVRMDKLRDEREEYEQRIRKTKESRAELEQNRSAIQSQLQVAEEDLKKALSELNGMQQKKNGQVELLESYKNDMFQSLQEIAQKRNAMESLKRRADEIEANLGRIAKESEKLCEDLERARRSSEILTEALAEVSELRKEHSERKEELSTVRRNMVEKIKVLRNDLASLERELAGSGARLGSLEEMQRDFASYEHSVQFLMKNQETLHSEALLGPLAELIEVSPEYEKALIAAVGHRLRNVVVSSTRDGANAAKRLKEEGQGRSTFIPIVPRLVPDSSETSVPEGVTQLKEIVHFQEGFETLKEFLLTGYFVVRDMEQAVEIWSRNGIQIDLVTLGGDLLTRHGEITGGSWDFHQEEIFLRRREIKSLREGIDSMERAVSDCVSNLLEHEEQLERVSGEMEEIERSTNELKLKEANGLTEQGHIAAQISSWERTERILKLETERLGKEKVENFKDISQAQEKIVVLESRKVEVETGARNAKLVLEKLDTVLQEKSAQSQEVRVLAARLDEQYRSVDREFHYTVENLQQMEKYILGLAEEKARLLREQDRISRDLEEAQTREKELMLEYKALETVMEDKRNESASLTLSIKSLEQERTSCASAMKDLRDKVHALEMESVRIKQIVEGVVEKILERYHVDPRTVSCTDSRPNSDEILEVKAKLESMGEVNLAAIAESRQVSERLKFLEEQEQDLRKAVASLFDTIEKINKSTSDLFLKTFDGINKQFQEIFPFLFGGGEAYLELTEEENLLETGVDIVVRPPGKRRQNMSLLSGGEKSLTAIALIFSIFLTRPSPFCLLDEVDAPLDDSNIVRFTEMLKKLSDRTQFIVITHNKRTMEAADSLYGVTMEEPGASTVVSVQFAA